MTRTRTHSGRLCLAQLCVVWSCMTGQALAQAAGGASLDAEFHDEYDQPVSASPASTPAAPPPTAAVASAGTRAAADEPGAAAETSAPAAEANDRQALAARVQSSWHGASGGVHLVDASSGLPGSLRLSLGFDYFRGRGFLYAGDSNENVGGTLALSLTPAEHFEVFGSLANHANSNNLGDPVLMQIVGDLLLGVKAYTNVLPWLDLGGDLRLVFLNTIGDLGIVAKGTSLGLRGDATADLRRLDDPLPLIFRGNLDYLFDNSGQLITAVEDARYAALSPATRRARANEDRNLLTRVERFALGINRVDMFTLGLGVEAPLRAARDFYIQPLVEWTLGLPANRQGYNCLAVNTNARAGQEDGCLAFQKLAAAPSILTLGARVLPPLAGFSALIGVDIGLLGSALFVRELSPTRPWTFLFALSYGPDVRKPKPEVRPVAAAPGTPSLVSITPAQPKSRVVGAVVEQGTGTPIAAATVRYPGRALTAQLTGDDGRFVSYELEPGEVSFEISHADHEPTTCSVNIVASAPLTAAVNAPSASARASSGLLPVAPGSADGSAGTVIRVIPAASGPDASPEPSRLEVPLRCELPTHARASRVHGALVNEIGVPVPSVAVDLSGPAQRTVSSGAHGEFLVEGLPPGVYSARIDASGYESKVQSFTVAAGDMSLRISLVGKASAKEPLVKPVAREADALVVMTAREVKIRKQIMFKPNSAEIDPSSDGLLGEIANVLAKNPQVERVQVQGHTDNRGEPAQNLDLSQRRAESVVQRLVRSGIAAERLTARGYGDSRPLVPNLTPSNRARNRRVQFIIVSQ